MLFWRVAAYGDTIKAIVFFDTVSFPFADFLHPNIVMNIVSVVLVRYLTLLSQSMRALILARGRSSPEWDTVLPSSTFSTLIEQSNSEVGACHDWTRCLSCAVQAARFPRLCESILAHSKRRCEDQEQSTAMLESD